MSVDTYYDVLGLPETATQADIKSAYRNLIKQVHPDTLATLSPYLRRMAEDKSKEMNEAYSVLSDATKRRQYDFLIAEHRQQTGPAPSPPPKTAAAPPPKAAATPPPRPHTSPPSPGPQPQTGRRGYNWRPLRTWAGKHPVLVCGLGIFALVLVVSLLPDSGAPQPSQSRAVLATNNAAAPKVAVVGAPKVKPDFSDVDKFVQDHGGGKSKSSGSFDDIDSFVAGQAKGAPGDVTPPNDSASGLSGDWHGEYTNRDTNQITKVTLQISEGRSDLLTGTLVFDPGKSNSGSCLLTGVYNPQNKFLLLNVGNCQGRPPNYLQGNVGFSSVKPTDRRALGVDSLHNGWLDISRK